jgi:3-methyladenine DNA glycosylase/8-oxoguanine DNA glycosylase
MAKMFFLGDANILPAGDLGIKKACNNFFPNVALDSIEEIYKPFNSYLSMNLWDSLD